MLVKTKIYKVISFLKIAIEYTNKNMVKIHNFGRFLTNFKFEIVWVLTVRDTEKLLILYKVKFSTHNIMLVFQCDLRELSRHW